MSDDRKYDTDPLDPEFARRTEEIAGRTETLGREPQLTPRPNVVSEEPTRRFADQPPNPYPSVFAPPTYQPPPAAYGAPSTLSKRPVQKLGIPENIASALAYAPFFIGLVVSLVEMLLLPRTEARTRAHASQALGIHFVVLAAGLVFNLARLLANVALGGFALGMLGLISGLFSLGASILLVVTMIRVWKGEDVQYKPLKDLAGWINEHLDPMK